MKIGSSLVVRWCIEVVDPYGLTTGEHQSRSEGKRLSIREMHFISGT